MCSLSLKYSLNGLIFQCAEIGRKRRYSIFLIIQLSHYLQFHWRLIRVTRATFAAKRRRKIPTLAIQHCRKFGMKNCYNLHSKDSFLFYLILFSSLIQELGTVLSRRKSSIFINQFAILVDVTPFNLYFEIR